MREQLCTLRESREDVTDFCGAEEMPTPMPTAAQPLPTTLLHPGDRHLLPCRPRRKAAESMTAFVNRTLRSHIWPRLPSHPPPTAASRSIILITVTSSRGGSALQLLRLEHLVRTIADEPGILWMVVEDAARISVGIGSLLQASGINHRHAAFGPTHRGGNAQRDLALRMVRQQQLEGVGATSFKFPCYSRAALLTGTRSPLNKVYMMDDDNAYHPLLWNELRRVGKRRVAVLPTRVRRFDRPPSTLCHEGTSLQDAINPNRWLVERPLYDRRGTFERFVAGWCADPTSYMVKKLGPRKFCVDMGGFAFDALLLQQQQSGGGGGGRGSSGGSSDALWNYTGRGGESEFIEWLLPRGSAAQALQPLADCCSTLLVYHNDYRHEVALAVSLTHRKRRQLAVGASRCGWAQAGLHVPASGVEPARSRDWTK